MEIFNLTIDDVENFKDQIVSMLQQSFEKSFPDANFDLNSFYERVALLKIYLTENKAKVYGCKIDGNLAGFIWFFEKNNQKKKLIHINHLVVDVNYRRRGIASKLWEKVERYALKHDIDEIELFVTKNNNNAVNFYSKKNLEVERLVMKKRLSK